MTDTILVPFELPDPPALSPMLVEDLSTLDVVVLGHYALPEQTPAAAAREQFGEEAQAEIDAVADLFREYGTSVETRLVFGKDREAAINEVAIEENCAAELDPAPTDHIGSILVPLPGVAEFTRLPEFIQVLCEDSTTEITLFHVVEGEERREDGDAILTETHEGLIEAGLDPDRLDTMLVEHDDHDQAILDAATEYDAVVMYEPTPELTDRVFGQLPDHIARETGDPVIVVRKDH